MTKLMSNHVKKKENQEFEDFPFWGFRVLGVTGKRVVIRFYVLFLKLLHFIFVNITVFLLVV